MDQNVAEVFFAVMVVTLCRQLRVMVKYTMEPRLEYLELHSTAIERFHEALCYIIIFCRPNLYCFGDTSNL